MPRCAVASRTDKIGNCQIGVFWATPRRPGGRSSTAGLDRRPQAGPRRRHRRRGGFATKPQVARPMLTRALEAGVPAGELTADESLARKSACRCGASRLGCPTCWRPDSTTRWPRLTGDRTARGWVIAEEGALDLVRYGDHELKGGRAG